MVRRMEGHVRHLIPKILVEVNYCGRYLAGRLRLAAPAYLKKEATTPHPRTCKYSLLCDRRPDWRYGVWVLMWNIGCLGEKGGEVCEEGGGEMERPGCWG